MRCERIAEVDAFVARASLRREPVPIEALFLAGKAFASYRSTGGIRTAVLPDLLIGTHTAVRDVPLITRHMGRYRTYIHGDSTNLALDCPRP